MFSKLTDIGSAAVNNLCAWRQHLAMSCVPGVSERWSALCGAEEYPATYQHRPYGGPASSAGCREAGVVYTHPLSLLLLLLPPPDTGRPQGLTVFCPASKRRGVQHSGAQCSYRKGARVPHWLFVFVLVLRWMEMCVCVCLCVCHTHLSAWQLAVHLSHGEYKEATLGIVWAPHSDRSAIFRHACSINEVEEEEDNRWRSLAPFCIPLSNETWCEQGAMLYISTRLIWHQVRARRYSSLARWTASCLPQSCLECGAGAGCPGNSGSGWPTRASGPLPADPPPPISKHSHTPNSLQAVIKTGSLAENNPVQKTLWRVNHREFPLNSMWHIEGA